MSSAEHDPQSATIACTTSDAFPEWLARSGGSLAITTYQAGKVALVGSQGDRVSILMRDFPKPLGLATNGQRLALVTRNELWMFANAPELAHDYLEEHPGRYDALYLPRARFVTGDLHTHDIAYGRDTLWLVNTRFSCLARSSIDFSFEPAWVPTFISDLVPEDRCHLNGLALVDGMPRYVTALGETDTAGGWRAGKATGGVVIDVTSNEVLVRGLCMPHSPRWHNGQLWGLNSGTGEVVCFDLARGRWQVVCQLPGYLRGLSFAGPYALVGMSHVRERHIFGGLPLQERGTALRCGVAVVDLRNGNPVASFEFTSGVTELYDVHFLPGKRRPTILNADKSAIYEAVTNPQSSFWLRPSNERPTGPPEETGLGESAVGQTTEPMPQAAIPELS